MNYKGLLQEYCQKNKVELPKYSIKTKGFKKYICLELCNNFYEMEILFINEKKKVWQQSIAEYVYNLIIKKEEEKKLKFNLKTDYSGKKIVALFIDIENKQKIIDEIRSKINTEYKEFIENIDIFIVLSTNHHLYEKLKVPDFYEICSVDSSYKDAADIYLSYLCGSKCHLYEHVGVLTGDHFGNSLVDIINHEGIEGKLLRNIDDIIQFLNNLSE